MFRGVYAATSGMIAAGRKQQMLTNNLANAETPGFKQDQTVLRAFPDILIQRIRDEKGLNVQGKPSFPGNTKLGVMHTGVYAQEGILSFGQGTLQSTGFALDFALVDEGVVNPATNAKGSLFFAVQKSDGEIRYTKNGQFTISPDGYLTTSDGYYVLSQAGQPIQVNDPESLQVMEDGRMFQYNAAGQPQEIGRLMIAFTDEPNGLVKEGHGLLRWAGAENGQPQDMTTLGFAPGSFQVMQGFIEGSNVDVTQTMTDMMSTYRLFEANQKVLQAYDRSMEKTANEVGRVG